MGVEPIIIFIGPRVELERPPYLIGAFKNGDPVRRWGELVLRKKVLLTVPVLYDDDYFLSL